MFPPSSSPLLLPQTDEMVVALHAPFALTCRGAARLAWMSPVDVPEHTQEDDGGLFVTTVTVESAAAWHTGYYTCSYGGNATEEAEESSIYVYVPGTSLGRWAVRPLSLPNVKLCLTPAQTQTCPSCRRRSLSGTTWCLRMRWRWRSSVECRIPALT